MSASTEAIQIGGVAIKPGERKTIDLPVANLSIHTPMTMPVQVIRGRKPGPSLFVSAAIHGDEINGVEIIRRLMRQKSLTRLRGTLIAVPIVNVFGFVTRSRYMPDRRDLNRSFPGFSRGSLAGRLANLFMSEIVAHCDYGIDLHTGALQRTNLPQIRANLDDEKTLQLARAFGVPVIINAIERERSLRDAATDAGKTLLVYEAGEALRFEEISIRAGVRGVIGVMRELEMLPRVKTRKSKIEAVLAHSGGWARAPESGILRSSARLGIHVEKGGLLGQISDPFGETECDVVAHTAGVIIGRSNLPLVQEGDALFHIACPEAEQAAVASLEAFGTEYDDHEQSQLYD